MRDLYAPQNLSSRPKRIAFSSAQWRDLRVGLKRRCTAGKATQLALALVLIFAAFNHAHAQGCTQCLDSTRATPPQVQAAYRHAIYLLGGVGVAIFVTGALLLRRNP